VPLVIFLLFTLLYVSAWMSLVGHCWHLHIRPLLNQATTHQLMIFMSLSDSAPATRFVM